MKISNQNLLLLAVAGVIIYFVLFRNKANASTLNTTNNSTGGTTSSSSSSSSSNTSTSSTKTTTTSNTPIVLNDSTVVSKGNKGAAVKALQQEILLKVPGALPKYGADGSFGQETLDALQKYWGVSSASAAWVRNTPIKSTGSIMNLLGW